MLTNSAVVLVIVIAIITTVGAEKIGARTSHLVQPIWAEHLGFCDSKAHAMTEAILT